MTYGQAPRQGSQKVNTVVLIAGPLPLFSVSFILLYNFPYIHNTHPGTATTFYRISSDFIGNSYGFLTLSALHSACKVVPPIFLARHSAVGIFPHVLSIILARSFKTRRRATLHLISVEDSQETFW